MSTHSIASCTSLDSPYFSVIFCISPLDHLSAGFPVSLTLKVNVLIFLFNSVSCFSIIAQLIPLWSNFVCLKWNTERLQLPLVATSIFKCLSCLQRSGRFRVGKKFGFVFCGRNAFGGNIIKPGYLI